MHRHLLVFVPPLTAEVLKSSVSSDRLFARSKNPDVLQITSPPRPISTLAEISQVLLEYERSLTATRDLSAELSGSFKSALNIWRVLSLEQLQHVENDAAMPTDDSLIKHGLLWIVGLKARLAQTGECALSSSIVEQFAFYLRPNVLPSLMKLRLLTLYS